MATRKVKRIDGLPQLPAYNHEDAKYHDEYDDRLNRALWDWKLRIDDLIDIVDTGGGGGHIIQDEGVDLPQQARLNFIGAAVTATNNSVTGATDVTISAGGGGGGHVIQDEGTPLTQRANLNFVGANVTATDDAGNDASVVTIASQDTFKTIAVSGQSDIVADGPTDTLTVEAGSNITLTTNAGTDTLTITANVGSLIGVEFASGSGTWNVPTGVSAVWVTMVGAGGGGGTSLSASQPGSGGGSGESVEGELVHVTAGGTVAYVVGTGGATDTDGNDSTFGILTCRGGKKGLGGGAGGSGGGARGGAGGGASNPGGVGNFGNPETATYFGGSGGGGPGSTTAANGGVGGGSGGFLVGGAGGTAGGSQGGGGGGAATIYGIGGAGGAGGATGLSATSTNYGAGGGGGGGHASGRAGGSGAGGYILAVYVG